VKAIENNPPQSLRVLVADDDITTRMLAHQALTRQGFTVTCAEDGRHALHLFEEIRPHVVLLDVGMPHLDGYEVCRQLRRLPHGKTVPIMMVTGLDDISAIECAYRSGATDFVAKPINWLLLSHRIHYMNRASAALQELKALQALRKAEEKIHELAYIDSLTGLANRRLFRDQGQRMLERARSNNSMAALLFLDLDDFKRINDTLGHNFGDKLLQEVAERLQTSVRKSDAIGRSTVQQHSYQAARLGGDEFTVLLSEVEQAEVASVVAQRILDALSVPMMLEEHEIVITSTVGIAVFPSDGQDIDSLLQSADMAMYHAKSKSKSRFAFFTESMNLIAQRRLELENQLRNALKNQELYLCYQPLLDLRNRSVVGVEALLRWHSEKLGTIEAEEFIPVAETTGLITAIGEWVLRQACVQAKAWQNGGRFSFRVAVNVSARQFALPDFPQLIARVLAETGLDAACLELEITENLLMDDAEETINTLNKLNAMGVQLTIDDFGTGYSSLSYLTRFPIDRLKIDKSFIAAIAPGADGNGVAVVQAVMAMAHSLDLSVTAEGVETDAQLIFLLERGCHEAQGYYFSHPVSAERITALLQGSDADLSGPARREPTTGCV